MRKKRRKLTFFAVLALILALSYTAFAGVSSQYADRRDVYLKGASDIRFGIDIRGGVEATFVPATDAAATREQMNAAEAVIKNRLVSSNITDSEVYTDQNKRRIIVRFPWKEGETEFDPVAAIKELGDTAQLTFREGNVTDASGQPTGVTAENIILTGDDVDSASPGMIERNGKQEIVVSLKLKSSGIDKFAEATTRLAGSGSISIWMDEVCISAPTVDEPITGGECVIQGSFTAQEATALANKINGGALPFSLTIENYNSISPTLGEGAKDAMVLAGLIAFLIVCAFIIVIYRLPGLIASIALLGQVAGSIAAVSGYFPAFPSFTLTLPGIAGIILAIGMGVDANVITAERIREELNYGKTVDGSIDAGFKKAFSAVLDGNISIVIVSFILMAAFGPPDSFFTKILSPLFFMFGSSVAGVIYSFGFTLLVGVALNLLLGIGASKLMLRSIAQLRPFRNPWWYGKRRGS